MSGLSLTAVTIPIIESPSSKQVSRTDFNMFISRSLLLKYGMNHRDLIMNNAFTSRLRTLIYKYTILARLGTAVQAPKCTISVGYM